MVSADGGTTVLDLVMPYDESDERVDDALETLRDDLVPAAPRRRLDAETAVGGGAAESLDFDDRLGDRLPLVIGFVLLLTALMMLATFRSVRPGRGSRRCSTWPRWAWRSAAWCWSSSTASAPDLLGFTTPGFVIDWLPLFVLVVLVGLSMDYHVFVLSRVREHVRAGLPDPRGGRARHLRDGRRRDQRGRGDGLGVRDLRDAVDARDEDDGRRPGGRDPARRDRWSGS